MRSQEKTGTTYLQLPLAVIFDMNSAGMNPTSAQATAVRVKLLWVVQVRALEADNKLICDEFKFHWESGVRSLPAHGLTQSRSSDSWAHSLRNAESQGQSSCHSGLVWENNV